MYKIETTSYGLRLTFGGAIDVAEADRYLADLRRALAAHTGPIGVSGSWPRAAASPTSPGVIRRSTTSWSTTSRACSTR